MDQFLFNRRWGGGGGVCESTHPLSLTWSWRSRNLIHTYIHRTSKSACIVGHLAQKMCFNESLSYFVSFKISHHFCFSAMSAKLYRLSNMLRFFGTPSTEKTFCPKLHLKVFFKTLCTKSKNQCCI